MPHSTYLPHKMGSALVEPNGSFEAGSYQEFTLTYTAGYFGIDDTGSLKIVHRFASDMGRPQFDNPGAANYVSVEASNGAVLQVEYDMKRNIRPWDKTLYIKVVRGFLREGDQIVVRFGDRREGSPGMRIQTFCEATFEFRVLVDAIATYNYVELPEQPEIAIVPGAPVLFKAILPTLRRKGEVFRLCVKGEDRWGNPSNLCDQQFSLRSNLSVDALPASIHFEKGEFAQIVEGLKATQNGDLIIELVDNEGAPVAKSNPCRIVDSADLLPYWGDLHGQSEETIGTNSAWLNQLSAEFTEDDRFIVFPGWEWSGNTGLGGDRNVLHMHEGRPNRVCPHRWTLRRHQGGARSTSRERCRSTFSLGHLRMADPRCLRTGLPGRNIVQFRWPQGPARCLASGFDQVWCLRWADQCTGTGVHARRHHAGFTPATSLRHYGQSCHPRYPRQVR